MATLLERIQHFCVGAPTYFDCLPGDVLQFCIIPFLDWEDRIHLNMLTPPGDRTPPKKIPKDRIIAHQLQVTTNDMLMKLKAYDRTRYSSQLKRTSAILTVLQTLNKESNSLLYQYSSDFRRAVENKLVEFSDPANIRRITRVKQREEMRSVVTKLLEKMAAYPFSHIVKKKKWLSMRITQNETDLVNQGELADGSRWRRVQGDIYSVNE